VAGGAELKAGGDSPGGFMMNPTLLVNIPKTAKCYTEEIFAPVVAIYKFSNDSEVIELANDSELGLMASLWSAQVEKLETEFVPRI
jgi:acyl-CoA reductase-like NAD-dependent aldehyde dehydrogenase